MIKAILIIQTVLTLLVLQGGNVISYQTADGVTPAAAGELRSFEKQIARLYPAPGRPEVEKLQILLTEEDHPGGFILEKKQKIPVLKVHYRNSWRDDLEQSAAIGGIIAHALGSVPEGFRLPLFVAAALRHRRNSMEHDERFLSGRRGLYVISALLRQDRTLLLHPVLTGTPAPGSPAENLWYDEFSRTLLEILMKRAPRLLRRGDAGELCRMLFREEQLQKAAVQDLVWYTLNLPPPEIVSGRWKKIRNITVPELDEKLRPTGNHLEWDAAVLPEKLAGRPDRQDICDKFIAALQDNSQLLPLQLRRPLRQLLQLLRRMGKDQTPETAALYRKVLADYEKAVKQYLARAEYLDRCSDEHISAAGIWHDVLTEAAAQRMFSEPASQALRKIEKHYIGE